MNERPRRWARSKRRECARRCRVRRSRTGMVANSVDTTQVVEYVWWGEGKAQRRFQGQSRQTAKYAAELFLSTVINMSRRDRVDSRFRRMRQEMWVERLNRELHESK